MTPNAVLAELRSRGIEVRAVGDRLLYRPATALTPKLRERLLAVKSALLAELRSGEPTPADGPVEDGPLLEVRRDLVAVRLHSRRLNRDLWLCCDESASRELAAEFPGVPVLTFQEAARLRGKSTEVLTALLDVKAEFDDAVLEQ